MTQTPNPNSRRAQRYQERQHNRQRRLFIGLAAAVIAIVLAAVGLTNLHRGSSAAPTSSSGSTTTPAADPLPPVGSATPNGTFATLTGQRETIASFKGTPTLVWFVSTWCSSCQAGTKVMAQNLATIAHAGVHVKEIELYHDLGSTGPSMTSFAKDLAGNQYNNPDWTFGISSLGLTKSYDPVGYLDIYYLINSAGKITYINSSPSATMPELLKAIKQI
ncbi:hypothetical protein [Ferrimicrobium sp.]|uniref:TlpA family protein disulfide reductase n=1 Tax=Ferrimicrobium sp. TaxID=2926050 RepID=UPI00260B8DA0|nr:hypothetical protein [Ferrimicrobium sp.]